MTFAHYDFVSGSSIHEHLSFMVTTTRSCRLRIALLYAKLVKGATLKVIPGGPHGMCSTLKNQINAELLAFLQTGKQA